MSRLALHIWILISVSILYIITISDRDLHFNLHLAAPSFDWSFHPVLVSDPLRCDFSCMHGIIFLWAGTATPESQVHCRPEQIFSSYCPVFGFIYLAHNSQLFSPC